MSRLMYDTTQKEAEAKLLARKSRNEKRRKRPRQVNVTSLDPGDILCVKRGGVVHDVWVNNVNEQEEVHVDVRLIDPSLCPIDHSTITGWCARCEKRVI